MESILKLVRESLGSQAINQIGDRLGRDQGKTLGAVNAALPMLLSALGSSAVRDAGKGLEGALDKRHDGKILDDVATFVKRGNFKDGAGILGHVLGEKAGNASRALGSATGLPPAQATSLLAMLAPVVMGAAGKVKREHGLNGEALTNALIGEQQQVEAQSPGLIGAIGKMLDADGDGDTDMADLLAQGKRGLSLFF